MKGDTPVTIRISSDEKRQLDALCAQIPGMKRSGLVRRIVAEALDEIGGDARKLVRPRKDGE